MISKLIGKWACAAVVAALVMLVAAPASANIVSNSGFELGTGADADSWLEIAGFAPPAAATAERVGTGAYSGNYAIKLTVTGNSLSVGTHAEVQQQTSLFSVVPGMSYDFSLYGKLDLLGPGVVTFTRIFWMDSDGSNGGGIKGDTGLFSLNGMGSTYSLQSFPGLVAAPDSDAALVMVWMDGGAFTGSDGVMFVDDVALTVIPEPATAMLFCGAIAMLLGRRR